ncbi:peptidase M17, partial [Clostridium perfringens]
MNITIDEASLADTSIYVVYEGEESHFRLTESRKHSMKLTWFYGRSDQEADDLVVGMGQRSNLTL